MEQNIHVGAVAAADMSGEDVRWVSSDPVVRGAQDPSAPVRSRPGRTACDSAVSRENCCRADQTADHPRRSRIIKDALSRHAQEILRRFVRVLNMSTLIFVAF